MRRALLAAAAIVLALSGCAPTELYSADSLEHLVLSEAAITAVTAYLWSGTTAPPWADALADAARLP